jgi:lysophospholipase L1-like esterase
MCQRFAGYYNRQGAKVVHFILPRGTGLNTYANGNGDSIPKVALEFEKIAKSWGQYFIPLSYFTSFNMANYKALTCPTSNVLRDFRSSYFNGSDGLHPNVIGMETVADGVDRFLKEIV